MATKDIEWAHIQMTKQFLLGSRGQAAGRRECYDKHLTVINPEDYKDCPDKMTFLGIYANPNSPVKLLRSTNKMKVTELLWALNRPTAWDCDIFSDDHLPYYAMTAFLQDLITWEQISHILEFYELKSTYPGIITLPILNRDGTLTQASQSYFKGLLNTQRSNLPNVTIEHIEKFRVMLFERYQKTSLSACVLHLLPDSGSGHGYQFRGASYLLGSIGEIDMGTVFTPGPVRNVFYAAITPQGSLAVKSKAVLGAFSLSMIEKGHRAQTRIQACGFPGTHRTLRAHSISTNLVDVSAHDAQHQGALSYFPKSLYHFCLKVLDMLRARTGIQWSKEFWPLVDMGVIDSRVNVLNQKKPGEESTFARTYGVNESLTEAQQLNWLKNILKETISSSVLWNILLSDLKNNKKLWAQWIDVDAFIKDEAMNEANDNPLSLEALTEVKAIRISLQWGLAFNWPSVTDTVLGRFLKFATDNHNTIKIYLFNISINDYSDNEVQALIKDIFNHQLTGIAVIDAAIKGDDSALEKNLLTLEENTGFDYRLIALGMAVQGRHKDCVNRLLNSGQISANSDIYDDIIRRSVKESDSHITLQLLNFYRQTASDDSLVNSVFCLAVQNRNIELVCLLQALFSDELMESSWLSSANVACNQNNPNMLGQILVMGDDYKISETDLFSWLKLAPTDCIEFITGFATRRSHFTYPKIFKVIAKSGSVACARAFMAYLSKCDDIADTERVLLKMDCLLEGFMPIFVNFASFTQAFNVHHDMVKYQIHEYLLLAASLSNVTYLDRLVAAIFTINITQGGDKIDTLCILPLFHLLRHPYIKDNPTIYQYVINQALEKALVYNNAHYLRLILREGVPLKFDALEVRNISCDEIRCLLQIAKAVMEAKLPECLDADIQQYLNEAAQYPSFNDEMFKLIHHHSLPINAAVLLRLNRCIADDAKFTHLNSLILERVTLLKSNIDNNPARVAYLSIFNGPLMQGGQSTVAANVLS